MVIKMNMILLMMTVMTVGSLRDDGDDDDDDDGGGSESFPGLTKLICVDSNFIASIWTA